MATYCICVTSATTKANTATILPVVAVDCDVVVVLVDDVVVVIAVFMICKLATNKNKRVTEIMWYSCDTAAAVAALKNMLLNNDL